LGTWVPSTENNTETLSEVDDGVTLK